MSDLRVRSSSLVGSGRLLDVTPESAGWGYVGFAVDRLMAGASQDSDTGDRETCLVVLKGCVDVKVDADVYAGLGERNDVFDDCGPHALYMPPRTTYRVSAKEDSEIAFCSAPAKGKFPVRHITPEMTEIVPRGTGTNLRMVRNILAEEDDAESLLVVEVLTPGGHWSSYPPHKHDTESLPSESFLEETYYHRVNPEQGFAFQRVYTDDRSLDETLAVENGDVVLVPRGYHPVGAPHGYDLYYLNVMAGPTRTWRFRNDPAHEWMLT